MRGAWRSARLLAVIGLGLALAAGVALLERLPGYDWTALRQGLTRWWLARLSRALPLRVKVYGELPRQPALWVSNHVSWLDIPLLGALAPLTFLSKAEVRQWPLAGWLAEKAGTLFIRRGSGDGSRLGEQIAGALQLGRSTLIFPEGTRSKDGTVKTFQPAGVATLLKKCPEALIVPIVIKNSWKMVRYGKYPLNTFIRMTWEVLPPIEPEKRPVEEVVKEAEDMIKLIAG